MFRKRAYLKKEWCIQVIENPIKIERQEHNRFRFWGEIKEFGGRVLRVVTLDDTNSCVTRMISAGKKPDIKDIYLDL